MNSPLSENMTTMVKRRATRVMGLIIGAKTVSNQAFPLAFSRENLVMTAARNGMLRQMKTVLAASNTKIRTSILLTSPSALRKIVMKI